MWMKKKNKNIWRNNELGKEILMVNFDGINYQFQVWDIIGDNIIEFNSEESSVVWRTKLEVLNLVKNYIATHSD